jgi:hypothetical protein
MSIEDLIYGLTELAEARPDYEKAEQYYRGTQHDIFGNTRLEQKLKAESKLYRVNLAKTAVNVVADRLTLAAVTVPDDATGTALIADVWQYNQLDLHMDAFTRRACEYGDSYALVWPEVSDDAAEPADPAAIEIAFHDPLCMRLFYDPEHPSEKAYGIKRWKMTDGRIRATLYYADRGERWVIKGKDMKELEPGAWVPYSEDGLDAEFDNPYGEVPIFHFRTEAPYGTAEHLDAYGPQAAINKAMINQVATMGLAGFPARYALQDDAALDHANDDPDWDDDAEAEGIGESLAGMAQGSKMRNAPGALNWLVGVKDLKEFPAAPPGVFLEPMTVYARLMGQVTDTPGYRLNFTGEPPSGESLKVDNQPLNKKAGKRQRWFGATIQEQWIFILTKILAHEVDTVEVRWAPADQVHSLEDWQIAEAKRNAGVPETQVLLESGYSVDQVDGWQQGDREAMDLLRRAQILEQIGRGAQFLSTAVVAGVLDAGAVAALINKVMDDATPPDDKPPA